MTDTYFAQWLARKQAEHGDKWSAAELWPQFVPYFHSDTRIRVAGSFGTRTGTVGVTTGWKPGFLLMSRTSAHGSSDVLSQDDRVVAVKHGRKYEAV